MKITKEQLATVNALIGGGRDSYLEILMPSLRKLRGMGEVEFTAEQIEAASIKAEDWLARPGGKESLAAQLMAQIAALGVIESNPPPASKAKK